MQEPRSEEDVAMEANAAATVDKDSTGKNKRKRRSANNAKEPPQVCVVNNIINHRRTHITYKALVNQYATLVMWELYHIKM